MFGRHSEIGHAEIVAIGNEVISGLIQDTNSRYLSLHLQEVGVDVLRTTAVGDDDEAIAEAITSALGRVDLVITTGGLGSTHDDITKRVLMRMFGGSLRYDPKVAEHIQNIFRARGREVPQALNSQCEIPGNARVLYNETGTAPGLLFRQGDRRLYVLPGVPLEMKHLFQKYIVSDLRPLMKFRVGHCSLKTTGLIESALWERVGSLEPLQKLVSVASLPSHLGVTVRLSALGPTDNEVNRKLDQAEKLVSSSLGTYIYGKDEDTLEGKVGELLLEKKLTLGVAESCTGGLIGHRLTAVAGSSDYFVEGVIAYSNNAKVRALGVDPVMLERVGAVSEEAARAMAEGIRSVSGADMGLSVTGIAGPGGATEGKPVGLTFICVADVYGTQCERFVFHQDRTRNKERSAQAALNLLRLRLINQKMGGSS